MIRNQAIRVCLDYLLLYISFLFRYWHLIWYLAETFCTEQYLFFNRRLNRRLQLILPTSCWLHILFLVSTKWVNYLGPAFLSQVPFFILLCGSNTTKNDVQDRHTWNRVVRGLMNTQLARRSIGLRGYMTTSPVFCSSPAPLENGIPISLSPLPTPHEGFE